MCGIAGQIGFDRPPTREEAALYAMQEALRRRGPDARGTFFSDHAALAHTRLAVVDPENGTQPMLFSSGNRSWALVYNGELYNTPELKRELEENGHVFTGRSDTEVVLHAYLEWGAACTDRFNGIFAFAVWDEGEQSLFFARDRIGVKPFFFARPDGDFLFASEIKALLAHPRVEPEIDREGVAELMLIGPGRTPGQGVFRQIEELKPGWRGTFDRNGLHLNCYWRLTDAPHTDSFADTVETVRELVLDAVRRQLVSDVPVGALLSGGLDSSILSSVADRVFTAEGRRLKTFSVTYRDNEQYFQQSHFQPSSDEAFIRIMNDALSAEHHWVVLNNDDVAAALLEAAEARDLPGMADVDSSLLLFCRQIKRDVTVALSGECADEIFGGYPWYRDPAIREREGFPWAQSTAYRAEFLAAPWRGQIDAADYVDGRYRACVSAADLMPGQSPLERRMKEMTALNFAWFMQTLLDRKDRMSMWSGLEVRVPFCDWRIAQYLYRVPWEMKDYGGEEKGLLRAAMTGLLPDEVLHRKKSPYPKTHNPAYRSAVTAMLRQVLEDPHAPLFQLADRRAVEDLLSTDRSCPWYGQLMTTPQTIAYFVQLNHWMEHYRVRLLG